jgi:hypothetical protein
MFAAQSSQQRHLPLFDCRSPRRSRFAGLNVSPSAVAGARVQINVIANRT